uniref:Secreted protein n=1 Tax=Ixodes scapularis TaxID=6945 RepID=A0A4D5RY14_IXOSC
MARCSFAFCELLWGCVTVRSCVAEQRALAVCLNVYVYETEGPRACISFCAPVTAPGVFVHPAMLSDGIRTRYECVASVSSVEAELQLCMLETCPRFG